MEILKTIRDKDLGLNFLDPEVYTERKAARAIVFDENNNIALLHATKKDYYKLPGGGFEGDEDMIQAVRREVMEEIGCEIDNIQELGIIEEYKNHISTHQLSYCFIATLKGEKGTPQLTEKESNEGFETIWLSIDEAIKILEIERSVEQYDGKFINTRDLFLLNKAKDFLFLKA